MLKTFLLAHWPVLLLIYAALNLFAFILYGLDKRRAREGRWRIQERTLLWSAALFGALGAALGMGVFRHKTKHVKFRVLVPLFLLLQLAAFIAAALL